MITNKIISRRIPEALQKELVRRQLPRLEILVEVVVLMRLVLRFLLLLIQLANLGGGCTCADKNTEWRQKYKQKESTEIQKKQFSTCRTFTAGLYCDHDDNLK